VPLINKLTITTNIMKKITFLITLLITVSLSYGQELITNGTFESLTTGGLPGNGAAANGVWTSGSGGVNVQDVMANSYEGTKYINMGNDFRNIRQFFTATANTDYVLSIRYRNNFDNVTTTDAPFVSIRINDGLFSGNGTIIESQQIDPFYDANLKTYQEFQLQFNSGSNTNLVFYIFKPERGVNTNLNNAVRLDNISIVPGTLSNNDFFKNSDITISPNPADDELIITSGLDTSGTLEVFNILGKSVFFTEVNNLNTKINVSNFSTGMYILKIKSGNSFITKKFIKE